MIVHLCPCVIDRIAHFIFFKRSLGQIEIIHDLGALIHMADPVGGFFTAYQISCIVFHNYFFLFSASR